MMRESSVKYKVLQMLHVSVLTISLACKVSCTSNTVAYVLLKGRECVPRKHAFCQVVNCSVSVFVVAFQMGTRKLERKKCNDIAAVNYSFLACIQLLNTHFFKVLEFRCLYCSL